MTSKALTEKHIPLNDQQGPPTQGASCLKTAKPPAPKCPSSKLPLLGHSTALKETSTRTRCLLHNRTARSPVPRTVQQNPLWYSQRHRAPQTPYSSDHKNLRRTEITRLYARLYAAGPMMQFLLALGSGHGGGRLAAAALPPAAGRPRGAGPRAGTGLRALLRGDFGCSSRNSRTYFPS